MERRGRANDQPVLVAEQPWEKVAVMCPHVEWEKDMKLFRMWYSGGEQYEPNAIGYVTSSNGGEWTKFTGNPIFQADVKKQWEQHKGHYVPSGAQTKTGILCSTSAFTMTIVPRSGSLVREMELTVGNIIRRTLITPTKDMWNGNACYKPFAIFNGSQWLLWCNNRRSWVEQIGLVTHVGEDLRF